MVKKYNKDNINSFINFHYIPFSRKQCLIRIFVIWLLSALCLVGIEKLISLVFIVLFDVIISIVFGILIFRSPKKKASRFICDGLTCLYDSILLNLLAYRVLTLVFGDNIVVMFVFILLLFLCVFISFLLVLYNIKTDKYKAEADNKSILILSMLGAACGIIFAKLLLPNISQHYIILLLSVLLLVISFFLSAGSVNLLKAYFIKIITKN